MHKSSHSLAGVCLAVAVSTGLPISVVAQSGLDAAQPATSASDAAGGGTVADSLAVPSADQSTVATQEASLPVEIAENIVQQQAEASSWDFVTNVSLGVSHDDNIFFSTGGGGDTVVRAGAYLQSSYGAVESGNYFAFGGGFDYLWFAENDQLNDFNYSSDIRYGYQIGKLTGTVNGDFIRLNGGDRNVGNFAQRDNLLLSNDSFYEIGGKTRLVMGAYYSQIDYDALISSKDYRGRVGFDYAVTPKIRMGANYELGRLDAQQGQEQEYQRVNGTLSYSASAKVSLNASAGLDTREFNDSDQQNGIFSLTAQYAFSEKTAFTLTGSRDFIASPSLANQNLETTRFSTGVTQKLTEKISLMGSLGYQWIAYDGGAQFDGREDGFWDGRAQLNYKFSDVISTALFYERSSNSSSANAGDFVSNRVGMSLVATF